jgi:hypothetical protein
MSKQKSKSIYGCFVRSLDQRKQAESHSIIDFIQGNDIIMLRYNPHSGIK